MFTKNFLIIIIFFLGIFLAQLTSAAAPAFRSMSAIGASNGSDVTVTLPTRQTGDIMLLLGWVRDQNDTVSITGATGWQQVQTGCTSNCLGNWERGSTSRYWLFWKRATASESNPVFNKSGSTGDTYAAVIVYSGAYATGNPFEVVGSASTGTSDPAVISGITSLSNNSLIVVPVGGEDDNNSFITATGTNPSSYTEHYVESGTGSDGAITFSEAERTTAGATGNISVDWDSGNPVGWGGIVLALKPADNPIPTTTSISPTYVSVGANQFTLTINGTNFLSDSVVNFNGSARATTYISSTQLTATILASDLTTAGAYDITVVNPSPGGGISNSQTLTVSAASRIQTVSAGVNGATSITATWPLATTSGNLLVAIISVRGGSGTTITPPAGLGWTLAVRSNNSTTVSTAIYYIQNANSQSGNSTWGLSPSQRATIRLVEYSGIAASSALDKTATSTGSSSTGSSGTTAVTSQADEIAVAGISANNAGRTFSAQTNGFNEIGEVNSGGGSNGVANVFEEKMFSNAGAQGVSATISSSSAWAGAIATFKVSLNNPVPTTTGILPTSATIGSPGFDMTVNGTNFMTGSVVLFNGSNRITNYYSSTELVATILASDLTTAGVYSIVVNNPSPGGGNSNSQIFTVGNPVPTTTSISPNSKTVGYSGFTLTVNGTNFISSSVVNLAGSPLSTTYVSSTRLTATINSGLSANTYLITVTNPSPGGGTSNPQIFTIHNVLPSISNIYPTSVPVNFNQFTMTVNGANFESNSVVYFSATSLSTTYIGSNQLEAIVPAVLLTTAGTYNITVYNPSSGETSNPQNFTVGNLSRREFNYSRKFYGSASIKK